MFKPVDLADTILPGVGCSRRLAQSQEEFDQYGYWVPKRDYHDNRLVQGYISNTGQGQIAHEDDVGGFQEMSGGTPYVCTAEDGIADWWKTRNGLDINSQYHDVEIPGLGGWTYMDLFLAGMDVPS